MKLEKPQSQYTRQPHEKITLAECQAVLSAGILEAVTTLRVACRWAMLTAFFSLCLSILAIAITMWRT